MLFVAFTALFLSAGCGSEELAPPQSTAKADLQELGGVYKYIAYSKKPPPKQLTDLREYVDALIQAWAKIEGGDYVIRWNLSYTELAPAANSILAYEKQAPTEGGAVLLRNATVVEMTAAEFQTAAKQG